MKDCFAITTNNSQELLYVLSWAKEQKKDVGPYMWNTKNFPYYLTVDGNIVGWLDRRDRAIDYISFNDFLRWLKRL